MVDLNPLILTGFVEGMQANCPQSVGDIDGDVVLLLMLGGGDGEVVLFVKLVGCGVV